MNKLAVTVTAGMLGVGVLSGAPAVGDPQASHSVQASATDSVHWGRCPLGAYPDLAGSGVKCAKLRVPIDYAKPSSRTIGLEVSIYPHTSSAAKYKGVILTNPGGPGDGGLDLGVELAGSVPGTVGADYDWVSWDPRGNGTSTPRLHCQGGYFKAPRRSYVPSSKSLLHYWLHRAKSYADACERHHPTLLANDTTRDSALDMESIRTALGVNKISYYGYSYGTYLGQVYSTLFPTHLKYMVLDSNVNPHRIWYQANLDQDKAFQRNIEIYFKWVAQHNKAYHLGATKTAVSKRYNHDLATLTRKPDGRLGPDEFADAAEGAAYYNFDWPGLTEAWSSYSVHGHPGGLIEQYEENDTPGDDNGFVGYNAVQCTDTQWPTSWKRWKKDNTAYNRKYPFLTWSNAWYNAPCLFWGAKAHTPVRINGKHTASALLIDETLDAATPYSGSLEVRKLYPKSSLIAEPGGTTHADSLDGDSCVDNAIARYLKTGHRPARQDWHQADKLCRPLAPPATSVFFSTSAKLSAFAGAMARHR
jgi:pimeloyl-ACP methyl ester carboxylesterase